MLMYRGRIGSTSSKLIIWIISLGSSHLGDTKSAIYSPRNTPKFGWHMGGVDVLHSKPTISLKRGKIGPRLLLMTNWKSHTRFRLAPKSTTLNDLEGPLRALFQNTCVFRREPTTKIWMEIDPYCQRRRCSPMTLVSANVRFMRIIAVVSWRGGVEL